MLSATQSGGTAYSNFGRTFAFKVGAKTGSAQSSKANLDNSVFVAFAPYDDPEIAVCVVIEYGGTGGNASPVAKAAIDAYFDIKNSITSVTVEGELIK